MKDIKKLAIAIPLLFFLGLALTLYYTLDLKDYSTANTSVADVPKFSIQSLQDSEVLLTQKDLPEQPFLLNVWATWCQSCKLEHQFLNTLSHEGIIVVGLNYNDDQKKATNFLSNHGNPFIFNLFDNTGSLAVDLAVTGAPETLLIDSRGKIRKRVVGTLDITKWQKILQPCLIVIQNNSNQECT